MSADQIPEVSNLEGQPHWHTRSGPLHVPRPSLSQSNPPGPSPQQYRQDSSDAHGPPLRATPIQQGSPNGSPSHGLSKYMSRSVSSSATGATFSQLPAAGQIRKTLVFAPEQHANTGGASLTLPWSNVSVTEHREASAYPYHLPMTVAAHATTQQFVPSSSLLGKPASWQRAQEACKLCRLNKQRCDNFRPCGPCNRFGATCEDRNVPPTKTRNIAQEIMTRLDGVCQSMNDLRDTYQGNAELQAQLVHIRNTVGKIHQVTIDLQHLKAQASPFVRKDSASAIFEGQFGDTEMHSYRTGAQYLWTTWSNINGFYDRAGVWSQDEPKAEYMRHAEEARRIDIGSSRWILEHKDRPTVPRSTGIRTISRSVSVAQSAITLPDSTHSSDPTSPSERSADGGWDADVTRMSDPSTVERYFNSYMQRMWVMHPFIDPEWLKNLVDDFIKTCSRSTTHTSSCERSHISLRTSCGMPVKRKRSGFADSQPGTFARTIENAVIFLVLALGCILDHEEFLLHDSDRPYIRADAHASHSHYPIGPMDSAMQQGHSSVPSPGAEYLPQEYRQTTCEPGNAGGERSRRRKSERVPGAAYFSAATTILGNVMGSNEIPHAQAFLLAGLYYGQIGRIMDSWQWIFRGYNAVHAMGKPFMFSEVSKNGGESPGVSGENLDSARIFPFLLWSAQQLDR